MWLPFIPDDQDCIVSESRRADGFSREEKTHQSARRAFNGKENVTEHIIQLSSSKVPRGRHRFSSLDQRLFHQADPFRRI